MPPSWSTPTATTPFIASSQRCRRGTPTRRPFASRPYARRSAWRIALTRSACRERSTNGRGSGSTSEPGGKRAPSVILLLYPRACPRSARPRELAPLVAALYLAQPVLDATGALALALIGQGSHGSADARPLLLAHRPLLGGLVGLEEEYRRVVRRGPLALRRGPGVLRTVYIHVLIRRQHQRFAAAERAPHQRAVELAFAPHRHDHGEGQGTRLPALAPALAVSRGCTGGGSAEEALDVLSHG
mmetsp:Transcript_2848/g.11434  ORF Transcript_2848/g.11434 Transcript_2848/m.11434 type:complete len:244 (-) Transcript_2848:856-1587(-)